MLSFIITIGVFVLALFVFNLLMGYRKGRITLDLNKRYTNLSEQSKEVTRELKQQGRSVEYQGDGYYVVNGKLYVVRMQNVAMGGIPLQRTVLKPVKNS